MQFKTWLANEGIDGIGGGTIQDPAPDQEKLGMHIARKGAGAFPTVNKSEEPPQNVKSVLKRYIPRYSSSSSSSSSSS